MKALLPSITTETLFAARTFMPRRLMAQLRALGCPTCTPGRAALPAAHLDLPGAVELDGFLRHASALPNPALEGYTTMDVRLGWRPSKRLEISLPHVASLARSASPSTCCSRAASTFPLTRQIRAPARRASDSP